MIESNLAYDYVSDIPWESNPAFAFSYDSKTYLLAFQNVIPTIPVKNSRISFNNDVWDFNPYFEGINDPAYKFIFKDIPDNIQDFFKFFVLYGIMGKRKISTIYTRFSATKSVILNIINTTAHNSLYLITTDDIVTEVSSRNLASGSAHTRYEAIYQFCKFVTSNYKISLNIDLKQIKEIGMKHKNASKSKSEENKLPDIPEEYFNAILKVALNQMRDAASDYNTRVTACMIIMLSQLGMRIGDLLAINKNNLFSMQLPKIEKTAYYIRYKARKPSKPHDNMLEFDIFSNTLCTEAFQTMLKIRNECEYSQDTDYLFVFDFNTLNFKTALPISKSQFGQAYQKFIYTHLREVCLRPWDGITPKKFYCSASEGGGNVNIYIPDTRQYRVHLCTKLYENNVPLAYIQRYMGHLSEYMMGYYVRPKDTYQENIQYSEKVIKEIAGDGLTPLGGAFGADLRSSIQRFIEENNFNVKTDIKEIVAAMGDKVVIRGKTGGVCIKTSLMPCSKDARSNELFCAYNLCPNLFHFYYMVDVSYMDFQTLQESYVAMNESGQTRAAQKELNKLKDLCRRRLLPELDELDKELIIKGESQIISKYPSLVDVISNRENIRKEIETWMMKD